MGWVRHVSAMVKRRKGGAVKKKQLPRFSPVATPFGTCRLEVPAGAARGRGRRRLHGGRVHGGAAGLVRGQRACLDCLTVSRELLTMTR
jgi:hypothetical protein